MSSCVFLFTGIAGKASLVKLTNNCLREKQVILKFSFGENLETKKSYCVVTIWFCKCLCCTLSQQALWEHLLINVLRCELPVTIYVFNYHLLDCVTAFKYGKYIDLLECLPKFTRLLIILNRWRNKLSSTMQLNKFTTV